MMRLFASAKSSSVYGLVLVEAMHRRQFEVPGPAFPACSPSDASALVQMRDFSSSNSRRPNAVTHQRAIIENSSPAQVLDEWKTAKALTERFLIH
jgi:hypothetical protein